jgi:molybdate transport system ATP-binding protein
MTGRTGLDLDVTVADRVTAALHVPTGVTLAVIGPNGAGKSTLLHALAGLVPATGSALLDGEDLLALPVQERGVGMAFQGQVLFPHLSALANVAFGLRARGTARAEAEGTARMWLDRFGIGDLAARRPAELSGGQAQRVAIARALATDPRLLLLDEPFSGLDVGVAATLRFELARHLRDYDGITLLVTHEAIDVLSLADQVLVLEDGQVAQVGAPGEVAARPRTPHVARLVGLNLVSTDEGLVSFRPSEVAVSLDEPHGSPRLRWRGEVRSLTTHGDAVRLLVGHDPDLLADVTPAAAVELGLRPGLEVWLSAKATGVERHATADNMRS